MHRDRPGHTYLSVPVEDIVGMGIEPVNGGHLLSKFCFKDPNNKLRTHALLLCVLSSCGGDLYFMVVYPLHERKEACFNCLFFW